MEWLGWRKFFNSKYWFSYGIVVEGLGALRLLHPVEHIVKMISSTTDDEERMARCQISTYKSQLKSPWNASVIDSNKYGWERPWNHLEPNGSMCACGQYGQEDVCMSMSSRWSRRRASAKHRSALENIKKCKKGEIPDNIVRNASFGLNHLPPPPFTLHSHRLCRAPTYTPILTQHNQHEYRQVYRAFMCFW